MTALPTLHKSEQGFVLVFALVMLVLLTVLGVWATQTSVMDSRIANNERLYKEAFYHADGGLQLAERLLYANGVCVRANEGGFKNRKIGKLLAFKKGTENASIADFADQRESRLSDAQKTVLDKEGHFVFLYFPNADMPDTLNVDALDGKDNPIRQSHTTVQAYYKLEDEPGSSRLHDSGYEGRGIRSLDSRILLYTIESRHKGGVGGKSKVRERWKLSIGVLGDVGNNKECTDKAPYAGW